LALDFYPTLVRLYQGLHDKETKPRPFMLAGSHYPTVFLEEYGKHLWRNAWTSVPYLDNNAFSLSVRPLLGRNRDPSMFWREFQRITHQVSENPLERESIAKE
jgi:hypothetical protein